MSSTIETLERELAEAQQVCEREGRAVTRCENSHEAACSARDEVWSEVGSGSPELEELTALVFVRRRELYEAIDRLKAAEGRERRIKSRLMYVLPAERRRYLSGEVDDEFTALLAAIRDGFSDELPDAAVTVRVEQPGETDLRGDSTWRALQRLYSETVRRWVEVRVAARSDVLAAETMAAQVSYYAGGHVPRLFVDGDEVALERKVSRGDFKPLPDYETDEGKLALATITTRRYLDEGSISRLSKRAPVLIQIAEIARLYQTMKLTVDEIRWRLEQLISLRLEMLIEIHALTGERRRFSFYEIARAARLLDSHFPDSGVAAEALSKSVGRAQRSGVPLVDVAYMLVNH